MTPAAADFPPPRPRSSCLRQWLEAALLVGVVLALGLPGIDTRGIIAEEVQPFLPRHPHVLDMQGDQPVQLPPYEQSAPPRPRWLVTPTWPQYGWEGEDRFWPVAVKGYLSAIPAYPGILLGPWLGEGMGGYRRVSLVLTALLVLLVWRLGRRWQLDQPLLPALLCATSFGVLMVGRTGYAFEICARLGMVATLWLGSGPSRPKLTGAMAGLAVLCRVPVGIALAPALAGVWRWSGEKLWSRKWLTIAAGLLVLPVLLTLALVVVGAGQGETVPLSGFPWHTLPQRLMTSPRQAVLVAAWLGNPAAVFAPIVRQSFEHVSLFWPALWGMLPIFAGAGLLAAGRAGLASRCLLLAFLATVLGTALLYVRPGEFTLALPLEALWCLAIAEQLQAIPWPRLGTMLTAGVLLLRLLGLGEGLALDRQADNPMWSGSCQRGAAQWLQNHGVLGQDLVTTTYNQVGVLEMWSGGILTPNHAWRLLKTDPGRTPEQTWPLLLQALHPRWVLLSRGGNLWETDGIDPERIAASLAATCGALGWQYQVAAQFPTESGRVGWIVVQLTPAATAKLLAPISPLPANNR